MPQILWEVTSRDKESAELPILLFNAIQLINNVVRRDEKLLKALATLIIENETLNRVVFEKFFEENEKNKSK